MSSTAQTDQISLAMTEIVVRRLGEDRLSLPAPPEVATRCLALLRDDDYHQKDLVALLQRDPILTAQLLRVASSATYGGETVRTVEQASARLGARTLKTAILEACARQVFQSRDARIAKAFAEQWRHALAVALLARDVAAVVGVADSEYAYLTGLLHDIGKPVVAILLLEAEKSLGGKKWVGSDAWLQVIDQCHRKVGIMLAERWKLPEDVCKAIADCSEFDTVDRTSVANVTRFANAVAKREGIYVGLIDREDVDAIIMLGRSMLGVDEDVLVKLAGSLKQRVAAELP